MTQPLPAPTVTGGHVGLRLLRVLLPETRTGLGRIPRERRPCDRRAWRPGLLPVVRRSRVQPPICGRRRARLHLETAGGRHARPEGRNHLASTLLPSLSAPKTGRHSDAPLLTALELTRETRRCLRRDPIDTEEAATAARPGTRAEPQPGSARDPQERLGARAVRPFGRARYCQRVRLRRDAKLELLKGVPLFAKCSKAELRRIAMLADEVEFGENKAVIREGTRGREFFVVVEGALRVTRNGRKVSDLGAGDFVGELALVADVPRTATVTASTPVHLLVLTHRGFRELLNQSPSIAAKVLESLGERLHSDASRNTSRPATI